MGKGALREWRRALLLVSSPLGIVACGGAPHVPATDSREVCAVVSSPAALPRLYRRANAQSRNLGPAQKVCDVPLAARPLGDRCEDVDDLAALLGTGRVCGPAGVGPQEVCPKYPEDRIRQEPPSVTEAPCGAAACPNVQVAVHELSGTVTRVAFYDDPLCHAVMADPACSGAEHLCYYRVLAITSELR